MSTRNDTVRYRVVPDFPNYRVGTDGSFWYRRLGRAFPTSGLPRERNKEWILSRRKCVANSRGRLEQATTTLRSGTRTWQTTLAAIILTTFIGPRPNSCLACHKDDNSENNRLTNLYWGTPTENCDDRTRNGNSLRGEKNHKAKITAAQAQTIRQAKGVRTRADLSAEFKIDISQVSKIWNGHAWSA